MEELKLSSGQQAKYDEIQVGVQKAERAYAGDEAHKDHIFSIDYIDSRHPLAVKISMGKALLEKFSQESLHRHSRLFILNQEKQGKRDEINEESDNQCASVRRGFKIQEEGIKDERNKFIRKWNCVVVLALSLITFFGFAIWYCAKRASFAKRLKDLDATKSTQLSEIKQSKLEKLGKIIDADIKMPNF